MQTPKTFSLEIEKVAKDKGINHMDAVIWYCQKNDLEPDSVGRLITKGLKEKIEANARELNFLEKIVKVNYQLRKLPRRLKTFMNNFLIRTSWSL